MVSVPSLTDIRAPAVRLTEVSIRDRINIVLYKQHFVQRSAEHRCCSLLIRKEKINGPVSSSIFLFRAPRGPSKRRSASLLYFKVTAPSILDLEAQYTHIYYCPSDVNSLKTEDKNT